MLLVTLDTNVLGSALARIRKAIIGLDVQIAYTTVTYRELGARLPSIYPDGVVAETGVYDESHYDSGAVYGEQTVVETLTIGESRLGFAALGEDASPSRFEAILYVIGNGSFPKLGARENLTRGERKQLRDAMILEAHARERRDILVSDDAKAYVGKDGKRRLTLEAAARTRIMTVDEFVAHATELCASHAPI